ncbi:hypothetical protein CLU79DRAFT_770543 [Phycomyces nitens]|nr:hypothetical protein CLU79DRAFT_770543 [Phycomyces nitens]
MLTLKHNNLSPQDLLLIEKQFLRTLNGHSPPITAYFNVLDHKRTHIYGHLLGLFVKLGVSTSLAITPSQLLDFFIDADAAYLDTPYHTFYHAADVVTIVYYLVAEMTASRYILPIDIASLMIAALCHDAGHTGYNNLYQINLQTDLAKRYHDQSVLESLSVDITRDLLEKHRILKTIPGDSKGSKQREQDLLDAIEEIIIGTDMIYHYQHQNKLISIFDSLNVVEPSSPGEHGSHSPVLNPNERLSLCGILMHAADINNTVRPWPVAKQWSDLVIQEFFRQGDAERAAGLPITPNMDRTEISQPMISLTFGDLILPFFQALANLLPPAQVFLDNMVDTRKKWRALKQDSTSWPDFPAASRRKSYPNNCRVSVPAGTVEVVDGEDLQRRLKRSRRTNSTATRTHAGNHSRSIPNYYRRKSDQCVIDISQRCSPVPEIH